MWEILFEGIKKFAGEIIGTFLLAVFLLCFPSFRALLFEYRLPIEHETTHQQEEEPTTAELQKVEHKKAETPVKQATFSSSGEKNAKIRYIVPLLPYSMDLRIEVTDPAGKRTILNRQVRSGEEISMTASYTQKCLITVYLNGESVWQERKL